MTNSIPSLPPDLALRNSNEHDKAFFTALYASTREDLRQIPLPEAALQQLIQMQQDVHEKGQSQNYPRAEYLTLVYQDQAIGRLVIDEQKPDLRLIDISIIPQQQKRGFGAAVIRLLQHRATASGCKMSLAVFQQNQAALQLYTRLGFVIGHSDALQHHMFWPAQESAA